MSTRSLVRFAKREEGVSFSEHPKRVEVQVYKHYDGYQSGHPTELAKFLNRFRIVNGLTNDSSYVANGLGCLAAQYVEVFKMEPGDLYLEHQDTDHYDVEYITYVWGTEYKDIWMSIFAASEDTAMFVGKPQQLIDKYDD